MQSTEHGKYGGYMSIFDEEDVIVAVFKGSVVSELTMIAYNEQPQGVPRRPMEYILADKDESNPTFKGSSNQPTVAAIAHTTSSAQAKEIDCSKDGTDPSSPR